MKKWEELDLLDNYLINAVASDPEIAEPFFKRLVSVLLQREVGKIKVEAEKVFPGTDPERRGIRLDIEVREYVSDETVTNVYDIEPHLQRDDNLPRMLRFRQAKIDSKGMKSGDKDYSHLPDLYVILITNYDIFKKDYMMYTFRQTCQEQPNIKYEDGLRIMYFNTVGKKGGSTEIENVLRYLQNSRKAMAVDDTTRELDEYIASVRKNAELKGAYMTVGEWVDYERKQEREETTARVTLSTRLADILELLEDKGEVSEELKNRIMSESDMEKIKYLHKLAAKSNSIDEFERALDGD